MRKKIRLLLGGKPPPVVDDGCLYYPLPYLESECIALMQQLGKMMAEYSEGAELDLDIKIKSDEAERLEEILQEAMDDEMRRQERRLIQSARERFVINSQSAKALTGGRREEERKK